MFCLSVSQSALTVSVCVCVTGVTAVRCSLSTVPGSSAGTVRTLTSVRTVLRLVNTTADTCLDESTNLVRDFHLTPPIFSRQLSFRGTDQRSLTSEEPYC